MSNARLSFGNPLSKAAKGKNIATTSGAPHPWPRPAHQRFVLPDSSLPLNSDEAWDQNDAYYYNNWLDIDVEPTRFLCPNTLMSLGVYQGVSDILARAQLTELASTTDVLYPDVVRQCLASAKLTFANPKNPIASQGTLSFFANGRKCSITIKTLCTLYGFDSGSEAVALPTAFKAKNAFWNFIARGQYASRKAAQSSIRNPAIRIAAKALSLLLFAQEDTSKVRVAELVLLYNGVRDVLSTVPDLACDVDLDVNMGAVFARVITEKRTMDGKGKTERIGSLLTRLFIHLGVDLSNTPSNDEDRLMDINFFISCQIVADATIYRFTGRDDRVLFCRLPQPAITDLKDGENIGFTPDIAYLCDETGEPISQESTQAGAAAPEDDEYLSTDEIEDLEAATAEVRKNKASQRRPYRSEYTLRPISDEPTEAEYRTWMISATKKNNGLLRRMLWILQKACITPVPSATWRAQAAAQAAPPAARSAPSPAPRKPAPPSTVPSSSGRATRSSKRKKPTVTTTTDVDEDVDHDDIYAMSD